MGRGDPLEIEMGSLELRMTIGAIGAAKGLLNPGAWASGSPKLPFCSSDKSLK
jgi:hypothetical protein